MKTRIAAGLLAGAALLALAGISPLMAHGPQGSQEGPRNEFFEHMAQMRDIMHQGTFANEPVADGVRVTLTASEPALVEAIKNEFGGRHEIALPYPGTTVEVAELAGPEGGVALTFTSQEAATVEWLQGRGNDLVYGILRENMFALMSSQGFGPGRGHGPGMMGGGWMHRGQGPGGMHGGGPGWMHGGGMMGGGWMHGGPGMMGGWWHGGQASAARENLNPDGF